MTRLLIEHCGSASATQWRIVVARHDTGYVNSDMPTV